MSFNLRRFSVYWKSVQLNIAGYRGKKLGSALLDAIENEARKHNVHLIHLDTFDFQAKEFYEKKGYEVFGVLEDCPAKHCRYYLKRVL
jgi:GNAT superfamily N-acetyltransferase